MERDLNLELQRLDERVEETGRQAEAQQATFGPISGRADVGDGSISVEVAPGGLLTDVRLSSAALSRGPQVLAQQLFDLAERATRQAGASMHAALSPVLGEGGEQHLASLGYQPIEDDEEGEPPGRVTRAGWRSPR
ncbi:MAG: YbaB/EbfC family DNA-binding protein [Pseudonocardiaceae bacterium]|nr:YbaB/EbfC family DNA-binding protein [Pseudonocardiaceae bacterium]